MSGWFKEHVEKYNIEVEADPIFDFKKINFEVEAIEDEDMVEIQFVKVNKTKSDDNADTND